MKTKRDAAFIEIISGWTVAKTFAVDPEGPRGRAILNQAMIALLLQTRRKDAVPLKSSQYAQGLPEKYMTDLEGVDAWLDGDIWRAQSLWANSGTQLGQFLGGALRDEESRGLTFAYFSTPAPLDTPYRSELPS